MAGVEGTAGFQLEDHPVLDDQISVEIPNDLTTVMNGHWNLPFDAESALPQSDYHRSLVHRFEEAVAELVMDVIEGPNDRVGQVGVEHGWNVVEDFISNHGREKPRKAAEGHGVPQKQEKQ